MGERIYLRIVEEKDMKLLFDWRNDELVRKNSFSIEPVQLQEHIKWFNATLENSSVLFFIMMCGEQAVGQIRITLEYDNTAIINYSIVEKHRGLGYGKYILCLAETELYKHSKDKYVLKALVKSNNIASQVLFESLGYHFQQDDSDNYKIYFKIPKLMKYTYVCPPPME